MFNKYYDKKKCMNTYSIKNHSIRMHKYANNILCKICEKTENHLCRHSHLRDSYKLVEKSIVFFLFLLFLLLSTCSQSFIQHSIIKLIINREINF